MIESIFEIWKLRNIELPFLVREPITGSQVVVKSYDWVNQFFRGYIVSYYSPELYLKLEASGRNWRFVSDLKGQKFFGNIPDSRSSLSEKREIG